MIFVLSLHRSGTQSTHIFLKNAGYNSIHNPSGRSKLDFQSEWLGHEDDLDYIFSNIIEHISPTFNAVSDNPMAALHEQAFSKFPNAKFILTIRDPQKWINSVRQHIGDRELVTAEKIQYWRYLNFKPSTLSEINDEALRDLYLKHQKITIDFFEHNHAHDNLCVIDLEKDNNINSVELSKFLGITTITFPNIDDKKKTD